MKKIFSKVQDAQKMALKETLSASIELVTAKLNRHNEEEVIIALQKPVFLITTDFHTRSLHQTISIVYFVKYNKRFDDLFMLNDDKEVLGAVSMTSATMAHIIFNALYKVAKSE